MEKLLIICTTSPVNFAKATLVVQQIQCFNFTLPVKLRLSRVLAEINEKQISYRDTALSEAV